MEKLKSLVNEANTALKNADHLTYITYQQVKELKLLYVIIKNIYTALTKGMEAVLHYERMYKRIPLIPGNLDYELQIFKSRCLDKYNLPQGSILLMKDLQNMIEAKKKGPVDFIRKDNFVICTNDYSMKVLNLQKVKHYLADTKVFMDRVNRTVRLK